MKSIYLDTNIILSFLRTQEDIFEHVKKLTELRNYIFFTGTISFLELTSVFSREQTLFKEALVNLSQDMDIRELISLSFEEQIFIIIEFLFKSLNITLLDEPPKEKFKLNEKFYDISSLYLLGLKMSEKLKLRTLDLIHVTTMMYYSQIKNLKFDYFLTNDKNILLNKKDLQSHVGFLVLTPESFLQLET